MIPMDRLRGWLEQMVARNLLVISSNSHDYHHEITAPDCSLQNGMAERPHRTLKEKIRCMLYAARLDTSFWVEALLHATWLYNRQYHSAIEKTPFEAFTGR